MMSGNSRLEPSPSSKTIVLGEGEVAKLFDATAAFPGFSLTIDLERQTVGTKDGSLAFRFEVEPFRKKCLLEGLDDIALTLRLHERYDHSYYFISTFMDEHLKWHAERLG